MTRDDQRSWYTVRCIFSVGFPLDAPDQLYEERITLWRAVSADAAIQRAEQEALEYARSIADAPDTYLKLAQSYKLEGKPGDGAEIFSLMRGSTLQPAEYLDTFFDTGTERQQRS